MRCRHNRSPGRGVANLHDVIAEGSTVHDRRRQLDDHVHGVPTGLASEVCVRWVMSNVAPSSHNDTKSAVAICPASRTGRSVNQPVFGDTSIIVNWSSSRVPPSASCTNNNDTSSPADSLSLSLSSRTRPTATHQQQQPLKLAHGEPSRGVSRAVRQRSRHRGQELVPRPSPDRTRLASWCRASWCAGRNTRCPSARS